MPDLRPCTCDDPAHQCACEPDVSGRDVVQTPLVQALARDLADRFPLGTFDDDPAPVAGKGDPDYRAALDTLWELHQFKSGSYGTGDDPFRNFTDLAVVVQGEPDEYPLRRIVEKAIRQVNLLKQERWEEAVEDYLDIAGLALICYVLAKRRVARAE